MSDKPTQAMWADDEPAKKTNPTPQKPAKTEKVELNGEGHVLDLPSKGLLGYPSSVQYREMYVKDEETIAQVKDKNYFRTVNGLIGNLLNNPDWFNSMCIHDRDYILIYIWSTTYSPDKDITVQCPHCEAENQKTVDFRKLDFSDLNDRFSGSYTMTLENGDQIVLRLNTVGDENEVEQFLAAGDNSKKHRYEHLMLVKSIDIGTPLLMDQKINWVNNNISARDMKIIRGFHARLNFGVPAMIEHDCNNCERRFPNPLPFGIEDILFPNNPEPDIEMFL